MLVPRPTEVPPGILYAIIFIKYLPTCSKWDTGLDCEDTGMNKTQSLTTVSSVMLGTQTQMKRKIKCSVSTSTDVMVCDGSPREREVVRSGVNWRVQTLFGNPNGKNYVFMATLALPSPVSTAPQGWTCDPRHVRQPGCSETHPGGSPYCECRMLLYRIAPERLQKSSLMPHH